MHEGEGEIHPKQEKQSKREQEKRRRESAREKKKNFLVRISFSLRNYE